MKKLKSCKGLSLIELLVAVSISSIVLLMATTVITSSYNSYNRENMKANLRNTLQTTVTTLAESVMEGDKEFVIESEKSMHTAKYGVLNENTTDPDYVPVYGYSKSTGKHIYYDASTQKLYLCNKPYTQMGEAVDGCVLAEHVTDFSITVDESSLIKSGDTITGYKNPMKIKIHVQITRNKMKESYDQTVVMRDKISKITVNGAEFDVTGATN